MGSDHTARARARLATAIVCATSVCFASGCDLESVRARDPSSDDAREETASGPLTVAWPDAPLSAGFGRGLDALATHPPEEGSSDVVRMAMLKSVDAPYLELLQNVNRAEREAAARPRAKADAWGALAAYEGDNPLRTLAERRRDAWTRAADDLDTLASRYAEDKRTLERLLAIDAAVVSDVQKTSYEIEFTRAYAPWQADLEIALGEPTPEVKAARDARSIGEKLGRVRVTALGGLDVQRLGYDATDASGATIGDPSLPQPPHINGTGDFEGDAGSLQGYVGAEIALPRLFAPGLGLAAIGRYAFGNEVSRVTAGLGLKGVLVDPKSAWGLTLGGYVSYAKLLDVREGAACDKAGPPPGTSSIEALGCLEQDRKLVDGSRGGVDLRVSLAYDILLGRFLQLSAGGSLGYALFPYVVEGVDDRGRRVEAHDVANGINATIDAGLGFRL